MNASALLAFVHHLAAFMLAGAVLSEFVLFERSLTLERARKLQRLDVAYGIPAGVLLAAGLLRVLYFEKGSAYYLHNLFFIAKASLFLVVALLSIYPTVLFLSWNKQLKAGFLPQLSDVQFRRVRAVIVGELFGIAGILLFAPLMARGIGTFG
jgi:putative membrane protein